MELANTIVFGFLPMAGCLVAGLGLGEGFLLLCSEFAKGEGVELSGLTRE